jgi:hypothetical protein
MARIGLPLPFQYRKNPHAVWRRRTRRGASSSRRPPTCTSGGPNRMMSATPSGLPRYTGGPRHRPRDSWQTPREGSPEQDFCARLFNLYGPDPTVGHLIPAIVKQAAAWVIHIDVRCDSRYTSGSAVRATCMKL